MSRLVWENVTYNGIPHRAAVTWSYSGLTKRMAVQGMRLFTTDPTPVEILRVPTNKVEGLLAQLSPPEAE